MVREIGFNDFSHIATILLMIASRGAISISEDMQLEGNSLAFAQELVVTTIKQLKSLSSIQSLLMCLCSIPLCSATQEFVDQELKIIDSEYVGKAMVTRTWLSSRNLIQPGA